MRVNRYSDANDLICPSDRIDRFESTGMMSAKSIQRVFQNNGLGGNGRRYLYLPIMIHWNGGKSISQCFHILLKCLEILSQFVRQVQVLSVSIVRVIVLLHGTDLSS